MRHHLPCPIPNLSLPQLHARARRGCTPPPGPPPESISAGLAPDSSCKNSRKPSGRVARMPSSSNPNYCTIFLVLGCMGKITGNENSSPTSLRPSPSLSGLSRFSSLWAVTRKYSLDFSPSFPRSFAFFLEISRF